MTDERRHYSRIAFHAPAVLVHPGNSLGVVVLDLSLKGALVRLPADALVPLGTVCMLHVNLGDGHDTIGLEARVAHIEGRYLGLLCMTIDLDSATHLRRLVELNLGDPGLLERELSALVTE